MEEIDISPVMWGLGIIGIVFGVLVFFGIAALNDSQDYMSGMAIYCQNVETWHETGGEFGWPPYKGECK